MVTRNQWGALVLVMNLAACGGGGGEGGGAASSVAGSRSSSSSAVSSAGASSSASSSAGAASSSAASSAAASASVSSSSASSSSALNAAWPPGQNFDLSHWKLQLPDADTTEIPASTLSAGYTSQYFYTDTDGAMTFWAPTTGATTQNSHYPRSELREMLDPSSSKVNWGWQGTHIMKLTGKVVKLPSTGKVIVAQIHAIEEDGTNAPPLVKIVFNTNQLDGQVKSDSSGSGSDVHNYFTNIAVGDRYDVEIRVTNGVAFITVNGDTRSVDFVSMDAGWKNLKYYFKAGNYVQDNSADGGSATTKLYSLSVSHSN
ncbi:MAG: polysaccharide lyase family 7 protein [Rhodocyclaceae bacterium]